MSQDSLLREKLCHLGQSLFERGLTGGSSGNISVRLPDGGVLMTPTGTSLGRLDPARLSVFDAEGRHIGGDAPTKEHGLHRAFYDTRSTAGAVVHLHCCHAVALSTLPEVDEDSFLPPITPYAIMQLGKVRLLPYYRPGDPAMAEAVRGLAGKRSAVMLANHGPVVAGKDLDAACNAMEELEATARLALLTRALNPRLLDASQIRDLTTRFDIEWDT